MTGDAAIKSNQCPFQALLRTHRIMDFPARFAGFVMSRQIAGSGFIAPTDRGLGNERRTVVLAQLVAIAALVISTIVAATVVSVGIARANVVGNVIDNEGGLFVVALVLGLLFIGMGGLTMLTLPGHKSKKPNRLA
jgi:hypothetical protein